MNNRTVDVYLYVKNLNKPEVAAGMNKVIGNISGVVSTSINPKVNKLLAVNYEPDKVSTGMLVDVMESHGYKGSLVGL